MKKLCTLLMVVLLSSSLFAQTKASSTWYLTTDLKPVVVGNITADDALGMGGLLVRDYTGANLSGPLGTAQARWHLGTVAWPINNTDIQQFPIYIDFVVTPKAGFNYQVDSVYASVGGGGTSNMRAHIYYGGTDTSFASLTLLNPTVIQLKQLSQLSALGRPGEDTLLVYKIDKPVPNGQKFRFRIYPWYKASSSGGTSRYIFTQNIIITGKTTPATSIENPELPLAFQLNQNYPNPFNPATKISYSLAEASQAKLVVYNAIGSEVATLVSGFKNAGQYEVTFNASNLPSGVYFYRLTTPSQNITRKMLLVK